MSITPIKPPLSKGGLIVDMNNSESVCNMAINLVRYSYFSEPRIKEIPAYFMLLNHRDIRLMQYQYRDKSDRDEFLAKVAAQIRIHNIQAFSHVSEAWFASADPDSPLARNEIRPSQSDNRREGLCIFSIVRHNPHNAFIRTFTIEREADGFVKELVPLYDPSDPESRKNNFFQVGSHFYLFDYT